jgi:hypothetical protein
LPLTVGMFVQVALAAPLPVMVKVTPPVALTTGFDPVVFGLTVAVKVTAWPVATLAGPVTVVVVATASAVALALNGFSARIPTVATAPAPATIVIFLSPLRFIVPPEVTAAPHRHSADDVRDRRRRCQN